METRRTGDKLYSDPSQDDVGEITIRFDNAWRFNK